MKTLRAILMIACIATTNVLLTACNQKKPANTIITLPAKQTDTAQIKTLGSYDSLRNAALSTTPEMLHLKLPATDTTVYGIVMDWETTGAVVTIVSFVNGDAGSYSTAYDEIKGGKAYKSVRTAAKEFVSTAQRFLGKAQKTESTPLPKQNFAIFYLLTNKGIFKKVEDQKNFDNDTSEWATLFSKGNEVSASLRFLTN